MNRRRFFRGSLAAAVSAGLSSQQSVLAALQAMLDISSDVKAVKGDGRSELVLEKAAVQELSDSLRGQLLLMGSDGYETARHVRNGSISKYPALIVQPTGTADIQNAVTFARERDLLLAVKCGGHSFSGKSTCDGGMMIDLSSLRHVRVDPERRMAFAAGGSLLGELDHESMAHDLVTTAGTVSHTGIGGLTLGGGFGRVARRYGLALDNVKAVDIVTADGQLRRASADHNEDLFWGVRGGGGNFGVVTSFEFGLHSMQRTVTAGDIVFPIEQNRKVLSFYADFCANAPDELYADFVMVLPPGGGAGVALIHVCHSGSVAQAEKDLAPLRKLGTPLQNTIRAIDYVAVQRSQDEKDPRALGSYLKSGFVSEISARLQDAIVANFESPPDRGNALFFQVAGGAISRVAPDATAFPHRYASHSLFTSTFWPADDTEPARHMNATREYWRTMEPFTDGYYTNETADEGQKAIDSNYQGNYERLLALKNRYDPGNLFSLNANIKPTV
jgi:FAD/FMN-containing dehydrogenase